MFTIGYILYTRADGATTSGTARGFWQWILSEFIRRHIGNAKDPVGRKEAELVEDLGGGGPDMDVQTTERPAGGFIGSRSPRFVANTKKDGQQLDLKI